MTANIGNRVRVGVLFPMFVVATLVLVMTHAAPALAAGSTDASFEANSYEFAVDENTAANTVVGTVAATDLDGDSLTYSVGGTDAAQFNEVFALNTSTGEITVKPDASIDYESGEQSYRVNVIVTDGEDDSGATQTVPTTDATATVVIEIVNVDEPGIVTLSTTSPQLGVGLFATLTDPDGRRGGSTTHGGPGPTTLMARSSSQPATTTKIIAVRPIRRRKQTSTCTLSTPYNTLIALVPECPPDPKSQTDASRPRSG